MAADATIERRRARAHSIEWLDRNAWTIPIVTVVAVLGAWELTGLAGALPSYILRPTEIIRDVLDLVADGTLLPLMGESLRRAMLGLLLGGAGGALLGLLTGVSRKLGDFIDGPVIASYPIPKVALFPAIAVVLGFNDRTRIIVIALVCFYPVYLNAQAGTRGIDQNLVWFGWNAEASRARRFLGIVLPSALPRLFVGIRTAAALSFVMLFATEAIGFGSGVGSAIFRARLEGDYHLMWAGVSAIAIVGFAVDRVIDRIGRALTRGHSLESHRG